MHSLTRMRGGFNALSKYRRYFSSKPCFTDLSVHDDYSILKFKSPPANVLTAEFMDEVLKQIKFVENSDSKGLILTSSIKDIFSPGLDLKTLMDSSNSRDTLMTYYGLFQDIWFEIYKSPLVIIAAINGHAIAGACGLALACDYRIMADGNYGIGITSGRLGIPMPLYLLESLQKITSWHIGSLAAQQGRIFKPHEALKVGLLDEVKPENEVLKSAKAQMKLFLNVDNGARIFTKMNSRKDLISRFPVLKEEDLKMLGNAMHDPRTKEIISNHVNKMKNKK